MARTAPNDIPSMEGSVAYPRKNGEPVFEEPWQSRAFGMVVKLHTQGLYPWDEFKSRLIEEISAGDAATGPGQPSRYYEHWVQAFCRLLCERRLVSDEDIRRRIDEYKSGARRQVF